MLAGANVRERWPSLLATFLAVVVGAGLVGATLIVDESARPEVAPRLSGTAALAVPPQAATNRSVDPNDSVPWSPAEADDIARRLSAVPGVAAAVPDRSFYAQAFPDGRPAGNPDDDEAGHGWSSLRLGPYRLVGGAEPVGPGDVAVDRALGVGVGDELSVHLATGPERFRVTGTVDGPGLYFSDAAAARRAPGVAAIGILTEPGVAAADVAGGARAAMPVPGSAGQGTVLTGAQRGQVEPGWLSHQRFLGTQMITAMAVLALFTTVFVVASTMALAIAGRRRELGLLRTIGATPAQIRRTVVGEALLIGLFGGVVGAALGVGLAPLLREVLDRMGAAAPGLVLRVSWWPLLVAVGTGLLVAAVGGWAASRSAARVRPVEALLDATSQRRPMTTGRRVGGSAALAAGLLLAGGAAIVRSDARMGMALGAAMALITAAALLAPVLIGPSVRALTAPWARYSRSAAPVLVRGEVLAAARRTAATAAPVIAAVGIAALLSGVVETMAVAYPAEQTRRLAGETLIDVDGTPGLDDAVLAEVGTPPGTRAPLVTQAFVLGAGGPSDSTVVDAVGTLDGGQVRPGEVVLSEPMAAELGARAGDTVPVRFVDGATEPLRVIAVQPVDPTRGEFAIARTTVRAHDPSALGDAIFVPDGFAPAGVPPGAVLRDAQSYALADYETDARLSEGLVTLLIVISVGYSGLAVANGVAMSAHGRRRDVAVLRSAGATRAQLLRIALAEAGVVVLVGVGLGLLVTVLPLTGVAAGLSEATGTDVALQLDPDTLAAAGVGCLAMALLATAVVTVKTSI
ncbi:MAG: ABC transporter permease [Pseudonocardia sp.]|nr:ABC transporter permease [Pseudonocardia sp.]